jgi:peptidyl-Lys metalloendopeptidase
MIFSNKFTNVFLYFLILSLAIPNWNLNNLAAIEMYDNNRSDVTDKENSLTKNSEQFIGYHTDWITNIELSKEFFDLNDIKNIYQSSLLFEGNQNINPLTSIVTFVNLLVQKATRITGLEEISLITQRQYLNGWELIIDQQVNKVMNDTNQQISLNNMIKYRLSAQNNYVNDNPIIINFTLENLSNQNLWVLSWYTPMEGLKGKIFRVICDGTELPYEGPMVKRGQPKKDDYIQIEPGRSVSAEVDLSNGYKFPVSEECRVEFKGRIYDCSTSIDSIPKSSEEHQRLNITGNTVTFRVVNS